jgi:DNA repair exonuclease SbcCD nuclease subunit
MNIFRDFITQVKTETIIIIGNHDRNLEASTLDELSKYNISHVKVYYPPFILDFKGLKLYLDHDMIEGAVLGPSNLSIDVKKAKKVKDLPKADMYLFGHVHKPQIIRKDPPIFYVGSIERIDFAERNEDKFIVKIDTEKKIFGYKKLKIRPMYQITLDLSDEKTLNGLVPTQVKDAIVKIVIKGTDLQIKKYNEANLRDSLKVVYKYTVKYEIVKNGIVRNSNISEDKSTITCFNEYAKVNNFDSNTINKGIEIINEYTKSNNT